jgi:hypothetical protein
MAELWYNSTFHSAIKCSPFKALYGIEPYMGTMPASVSADNTEVAITLEERQHFSKLLKEQLAGAQNRMKVDAGNRRSLR